MGSPASPQALDKLRTLVADSPALLAELEPFYARHDGVGVCTGYDSINEMDPPALHLFPIADWEPATAEYQSEDLNWVFEDLEEMYRAGNYYAIAGHDSEGTRLMMFTRGQFEGRDLTGKISCVAVDPVLTPEEEVAPSLMALLDDFAKDPIALLKRIGYCDCVKGADGGWYGDVPAEYLPDIRGAAG